jgi:nitrogenase molybdenum-iron protein alpha/beta subunit
VNVLASSMLTPGDMEALDDWLGAFGQEANFIPDLSDSLSGYLTDDGYASLTFGGAPVSAVASAGEAVATLVIGRSLDRAADLSRARAGVPDYRFKGLLGLADCDALTKVLSEISGRPAPARIERQRAQLLDAMVDCHFKLSAARWYWPPAGRTRGPPAPREWFPMRSSPMYREVAGSSFATD